MRQLFAHHHRHRTYMPKGHQDHRLPGVPSDHHTVKEVSLLLHAQSSSDTFILDRIMTMIPVGACLIRSGERV